MYLLSVPYSDTSTAAKLTEKVKTDYHATYVQNLTTAP